MKQFKIYYNFDIRSHVTDLVIEADRGTFTVEAKNMKDLDIKEIRERIARIAQDSKSNPKYYVGHSNYYKIEEVTK